MHLNIAENSCPSKSIVIRCHKLKDRQYIGFDEKLNITVVIYNTDLLLCHGEPSHDGDRQTFEEMNSDFGFMNRNIYDKVN